MDILAAPHRNFCGHTFCGACLASWAEKGARLRCPVCRKRLRDVVSDGALEGFIDSLAESGLPEEEYISYKERTGSWEAVKAAVYEAWVGMEIKADNLKRSSFDSDTEASDDHDDRDQLYNDPNEEWDFDDSNHIVEVNSGEVLLEDSDNEEPVYEDANAHDWACPVSDPDAEWDFNEHQDTADPDSDDGLLTDKEEPEIDGEGASGWICQFPDPSSEWNFGHQAETVDPDSDGVTVTESDREEPEYDNRSLEGWETWEFRSRQIKLTVSSPRGTVDPESDGLPSSSSDGGYDDGWADQPIDPSAGPSRQGGRFVCVEPDTSAAAASDQEQPENDCESRSEGGFSLSDPLWNFDDEQRFTEQSSIDRLPLPDFREEEPACSDGLRSDWDGLSEPCLWWTWVENQFSLDGTIDPESDVEDEGG